MIPCCCEQKHSRYIYNTYLYITISYGVLLFYLQAIGCHEDGPIALISEVQSIILLCVVLKWQRYFRSSRSKYLLIFIPARRELTLVKRCWFTSERTARGGSRGGEHGLPHNTPHLWTPGGNGNHCDAGRGRPSQCEDLLTLIGCPRALYLPTA